MDSIPQYDVAIVGAGPAGIATAIGLHNSGLSIIMVDKDDFPRDKTCGDAIPARGLRDLEALLPGIEARFVEQLKPHRFSSTSMVIRSGKSLSFTWSSPGYMMPRRDFDYFLLKEAQQSCDFDFLSNTRIKNIIATKTGFELIADSNETIINCQFLVGADGAPSVCARQLTNNLFTKPKDGYSVRQYFRGLSFSDDSQSLVFFDRKLPAAYFWVFPLGAGRANVGFGLSNKMLKKGGLNPKEQYQNMLKNFAPLQKIMSQAVPESDLKGGLLPFANQWRPMSGSGFVLVGDAAHLVDPFTGDGIQNAIKSGLIAAEEITKNTPIGGSLNRHLPNFEPRIKAEIWNALAKKSKLVTLATTFPWLVPTIVQLGQNKLTYKLLKSQL